MLDASQVTAGGTLNLLSRSWGEYNINELGLQKKSLSSSSINADGNGGIDEGIADVNHSNGLRGGGGRCGNGLERTYRLASHEMCVFGTIGFGASSVVRKAIHIPSHRIIALKKINIFEKVSTVEICSTLL